MLCACPYRYLRSAVFALEIANETILFTGIVYIQLVSNQSHLVRGQNTEALQQISLCAHIEPTTTA